MAQAAKAALDKGQQHGPIGDRGLAMGGTHMVAPLILVSTFKVKEGSLEDFKAYYDRLIDIVQTKEPRIIGFHGYLSQDGTEMSSIQIHPDAASFELHMQVLKENWDESFSTYATMVEGIRVDYYGATPPESALELSRQSGQDIGIKPVHIAGFTRAATT